MRSALIAGTTVLVAAVATVVSVGSANAAPTPSVLKFTASGGSTGSVAINDSVTKALTVKNPSTSTVSFNVAVSNTSGNAWSLGTTTCTGSLLAGRSCTVQVVVAPTAVGAVTATANLTDGSGGVASLPLSATGVKEFTITPPKGDFGTWAAGSTSPSKTFTVTNNHLAAISISSIDISDPDFIRTGGTCASSIAAKGTCTVNVAYSPRSTGLGTSSGLLTVAITGSGTQTASLSGRKVVAITVTPSPVAFGKVKIGAAADKVVTISSTATYPVALGTPDLTVLGQYSIAATTCTATLDATSTCTITLHFAPTSLGAKATRLRVPYDQGAGTVIASDNATGTGVTVPGAPTGVTASPADGAAVVSWTAPATDGGTPITGYQIITHASLAVSVPVPQNVDAATTSTTITGLTNGHPHTFTVVATNAAGSSVASAESAPVTPAIPGPDCSTFPYGPPNTDYHGCNFSGTVADNGFVQGWTFDFSGDNFAGANLSNTRLILVHMDNVDFTGADLSGANLDGSWLSGADLTNANLDRTQFISVEFLDNVEQFAYGLRSGGITGTPTTLPNGWTLVDGYLFGPGARLDHAQLHGAQLAGVFAGSADLSGADLTGSDLTGTNLDHTDLTGADLTGADLTGADLTGANLTGANLAGVHSGNIVGTPAALPNEWSLVNGYLIGPGAWLENANLFGAYLHNVDLAGANLTGANLLLANLDHTDLYGANLTGATLRQADLTGTTFIGATLTGVRSGNIAGTPAALPNGWTLVRGYLIGPGAWLENADLSNAQMEGVNLAGADLSGATLFGTYLHNANLSGADLSGATLQLANLDHANLTGANLSGANLRQADLTGADFTGATLDGVQSGQGYGPPAALPAGWTWDDANGALVPPI